MESPIPAYEPADLDAIKAHEAVDALVADLRSHPVTGDGGGLVTATRHIALLCHLTSRLADDIEYQLVPDSSGPLTAKTLGQTAGHLGRAITHYTLALAPLTALARPVAQATLQQQSDAIDHHGHLRIHLDNAARALEAARVCLGVPQPPAPPTTTTAVAAPTPAERRRS